jgi:hypothetical protein
MPRPVAFPAGRRKPAFWLVLAAGLLMWPAALAVVIYVFAG